ncbi:hypothetical protein AN219_37955 [Streptomyces nanshensis]|nr:hypothetical protein AN219_37955 [Streptomyces nanshensis]
MTAQPNGIGAHLLFERDGAVLLGKRASDAVFAPDTWHLPAGGVERESARSGAVREAAEELGLHLDERDLELVHVVHVFEPRDGLPRLQMFFRAPSRAEPRNSEPDKCSALGWFPYAALPDPVVDYTRQALAHIQTGSPYSEWGWSA